MTALITEGQVAAIGWLCLAWAFLTAAVGIPLIRKARARGKRLFVDLPKTRLGPPPANHPHVDHSWDGFR